MEQNKKTIEDATPQIISLLKKGKRPVSKTELARQLGYNPSTISKYVDILELKGYLTVEKYGNIHLVSLKEGEKH